MSHKFRHIKNIKDLENEIQIANVRRAVLLEEISSSVQTAKSKFSIGKSILGTLVGIASVRKAKKKKTGSSLEQIIGIATQVGGIIALVKSLKRK